MSKSKKSKKAAPKTTGSNAKNIKALIAQNKMIQSQKEQEEQKLAELEAEKAANEAAMWEEALKEVTPDEVIDNDAVIQEPKSEPEEKAVKEDKKSKKQEEDVKEVKKDKKQDKKKKPAKEKKPGLIKKAKETGSELKKVSWPSFKEVVKKTGAVLAVVIFFTIVLFAFDQLLSFLFGLFSGGF